MVLTEITTEAIEEYVDRRLHSERRIRTKFGIPTRGRIKPATVHKEFRVLKRILNVAVQKKQLVVNPCQTVEFPMRVHATTRKPHYMTASEQQRSEFLSFPPREMQRFQDYCESSVIGG